MKNSGISWIGEIPDGWKTNTIGELYSVRNEKVSDKDFEPLSVTKEGVVPQLETAAKTDDGDNRKLVRIGDFAINSRSDRRGSCGISKYDGSVSLINTVITPRGNMNPNYYNWLFHSESFADEFYKWGHGIVNDLWTTRWQEMKKIQVVFPPIDDQARIADFLDEKCAEIDKFINLENQVVEELKEYKKSIITEAVTHGLNPNVPKKDSGIPWIESIPKDWKILRLKDVFILNTGSTPSGFDEPKSKKFVNWFTPSDVNEEGTVLFNSGRTLNLDVINANKINLFPPETLYFIGIGATVGKVGYSTQEGYCNQQITALVPKVGISKFFYYLLVSDSKRIRDLAPFTTIPIINNGYLSRVSLLFPPLSEQQEIATYLDKKCAEIDNLIFIKQQKIEDLKEYKKSIIYEYVTGKKTPKA